MFLELLIAADVWTVVPGIPAFTREQIHAASRIASRIDDLEGAAKGLDRGVGSVSITIFSPESGAGRNVWLPLVEITPDTREFLKRAFQSQRERLQRELDATLGISTGN